MEVQLAAVIIWTQSVGTLGAKASIALMLCTFSCFTTGKATPLQPVAHPLVPTSPLSLLEAAVQCTLSHVPNICQW